MKRKTAELTGALLDAAVALAVGERYALARTLPDTPGPYRCVLLSTGEHFDPSSSWAHGGPLIERERYGLIWRGDAKGWFAGACRMPGPGMADGYGPTPLIAAMRAFVASKLGEEVELP